MSAELVGAYAATQYLVEDGDHVFRLSLGSPSTAILALYGAYNVESAAFITAYNPYSEECSAAANASANVTLTARLQSYVVLRGYGRDPDGLWPPEPSFLVLGISAVEASTLGEEFGQNALLLAGADGIPVLTMLR